MTRVPDERVREIAWIYQHIARTAGDKPDRYDVIAVCDELLTLRARVAHLHRALARIDEVANGASSGGTEAEEIQPAVEKIVSMRARVAELEAASHPKAVPSDAEIEAATEDLLSSDYRYQCICASGPERNNSLAKRLRQERDEARDALRSLVCRARGGREGDEAMSTNNETAWFLAVRRLSDERDEARAEIERLRTDNEQMVWNLAGVSTIACAESLDHYVAGSAWECAALADTARLVRKLQDARAEIERLRAAANERAIAVLTSFRERLCGRADCFRLLSDLSPETPLQGAVKRTDFIVELIEKQIDALRAETPAAPQPAPSGGVERAIEELATIVLGVSDIAYDYVGDGRGVRVPRGEVRDLIEQRIAALRAEQQAAPVPPQAKPPTDAPNDPTKNVCAIRRRSDGYWWECNGEHGTGWNDKRIRQAWTHRAAHVEVERMKASGVRDDVEVVELAPKPRDEDDPKTVAALALEAVKRDITLAVREKYSNPNLPTIYCDNNGNGWRINYDEMHTLLSGRIEQARSGTWFWPKPVEPAAATPQPEATARSSYTDRAHMIANAPTEATSEDRTVDLLYLIVEMLDNALAARGGAQ